MFIFVPIALFFLLLFLGFVESHWIAPAVLFVVAAPFVVEFLSNEPAATLFASLVGLLALLYAAFVIGRFIAPKKTTPLLRGRRD